MGDHLYTTDPRGELAPSSGYEREGIAFYAYPDQQSGTVPLFRLFGHGDHLYTTNSAEVDSATNAGYSREGILSFVYPDQQPGTVPLFRLFGHGNHLYTTNSAEVNSAINAGYVREGVACFVYNSSQTGTIPIFRWFESGFMRNFAFSDDISFEDRLRILERHSFAYFQITNCTSLSNEEKSNLRKAYKSIIIHGIETRPNVNASANIGLKKLPPTPLLYGNIWVNIAVLFPQGDNEIAQTLIHEMMHVAGYNHPNRCDTVNLPECPQVDTPLDGGEYYGTSPLQSELCIAGNQSLTSGGEGTSCIREGGKYSIVN